MGTITKTFTFDSTIESWAGTPATDVVMDRSTADGSPGTGCLSARLAGKNKNPGASYWKWIGTWEDLGVPSGATITDVGTSGIADYNWRCSEYDTGTGDNLVGPFELYDNTPSLLGTFSAAQSSVTGTTSWATVDGSSITGLSQASTDTVQLWMTVLLRTGNSNSGAITMLNDQITIEITYTGGGTDYPLDATPNQTFTTKHLH